MPFAATARRFAWMLLGVGISWTPAQAQDLSGDEIFRRSAEAYRDLSTYSGTTAVVSEMVMGDTVVTRASTAEIVYARPDRYRIIGRGLDGRSYQVTGDSTGSQLRLAYPNAETAEAMRGLMGGRVVGDTLVTDSLASELAIMAVTGLGNRAPFYKPALLGLVRGIHLERPDAPVRLIGEEPCGATSCYVLVIEAPTMRATYWVDSSSFLLRQLKQELTSASWTALAEEMGRSESDRSMAPLVGSLAEEIPAATYLVVFSNGRVDVPFDDAFPAAPPRE